MDFMVVSCDHAHIHTSTLVCTFSFLLISPPIRFLSLALEVSVHGGGEFFPSHVRMTLCSWLHKLKWKQRIVGGRMKKQLGKPSPVSSGRP